MQSVDLHSPAVEPEVSAAAGALVERAGRTASGRRSDEPFERPTVTTYVDHDVTVHADDGQVFQKYRTAFLRRFIQGDEVMHLGVPFAQLAVSGLL